MTGIEYATKIRQILKFKGIKIGEAEKRAGLATGYLSRTIKGNCSITFDTATKLAEVAGFTIVDVITKDIVGDYERAKIQKELNWLREREAELQRRLEE